MKVLRVSHSGVISAWRQRERSLRTLGVDVTLATAQSWNEGGQDLRYQSDGDLFVTSLPTLGKHPNIFLFDPRPLWRLLGQKWDILDFHEEPCSLATAELLLLRALRAPRVPFLLYSAQNIAKRYPPPFRWSERWALSHAAGAYVCNAEAGQILEAKGLRGELREIPLGVDTSRFVARTHDPPGTRLQVGYVGRLESYKGVDSLLQAVSKLTEATLEIVGTGPQAEALASLSTELGLNDRVTFRGFVDPADLPELYSRFDVVVVPSLPLPGWREQFCRVAVEAMASGIPIIASDTGALPEVVGAGGLLFAPGDADALHMAMRRLLDEPDCWARLRQAALDRAPTFSWSTVAALQNDLYHDVVRT